MGDLNGDGKLDLAVGNTGSNNVSILLGSGSGTFGPPVNFITGPPSSIAVGDFNGDGKNDLAVAVAEDNLNGSVRILLGNGDGSFALPSSIDLPGIPQSVTTGDFNADGRLDVAVANRSFKSIAVLLGNGDGSFSGPGNVWLGSTSNSVVVGDFNGDGISDLALAAQASMNRAVIVQGFGDGTFTGPYNFTAGSPFAAIAKGDFNGDGKPDLAVANFGSNNVSVFLNDCTAGSPPPTPSPTATPTPTPSPMPTPSPGGVITSLVSVNLAGTDSGNNFSQSSVVVSGNGRFVVFESNASNLVSLRDYNNTTDVYERDLETGVTTLVSIDSSGIFSGDRASTAPSVSADGRYVAFQSLATNLTSVPDGNNASDVFVRDMQTGVTTLMSVDTGGTATGNGASAFPVISADGRVVVFKSVASNLSPINDTNGLTDLYARDRQSGTTVLVSVNNQGNNSGNNETSYGLGHDPVISDDGRFVAFESEASDLVSNDTNGGGAFGIDVFVRDLQTKVTSLVSVNSAGTGSGNNTSFDSEVKISGDGRFVVFQWPV